MDTSDAILVLSDYDSPQRKRSQAIRTLSKAICGKRGNTALIEWLKEYDMTEEDDMNSLEDNWDRWQKGMCHSDCECPECNANFWY